MKKFMLIPICFIAFLTTFSSCEKDEVEEPKSDELEEYGILGQWKLEARTINGTTDMSMQCCDYITFRPDNDPENLKGEFEASGAGHETSGEFDLVASANVMNFEFDNSQKSYLYEVSDDLLTFTYEEDNQEIIEDWRKE